MVCLVYFSIKFLISLWWFYFYFIPVRWKNSWTFLQECLSKILCRYSFKLIFTSYWTSLNKFYQSILSSETVAVCAYNHLVPLRYFCNLVYHSWRKAKLIFGRIKFFNIYPWYYLSFYIFRIFLQFFMPEVVISFWFLQLFNKRKLKLGFFGDFFDL